MNAVLGTVRNGNWVLPVRVQPRAARNTIVGIHEGELRIRLTAPPVEGAANGLLCRFLADLLGIAPSRIRVIRGIRSRHKQVEILLRVPTESRQFETTLLEQIP